MIQIYVAILWKIVSTLHEEHPKAVLPNPLSTIHSNANDDNSPEIKLHGCDLGVASESFLKVFDTEGEDQESATLCVAKNTNLSSKI